MLGDLKLGHIGGLEQLDRVFHTLDGDVLPGGYTVELFEHRGKVGGGHTRDGSDVLQRELAAQIFIDVMNGLLETARDGGVRGQALALVDAVVVTDDMDEQGKEEIFGGDGHARGLLAELALQKRKAVDELLVIVKAVGEVLVARGKEIEQLHALGALPQKLCLELDVEQIHGLLDLGDTVRFIATEEENVACVKLIRLAVDHVSATAGKENGDLTLGVVMVKMRALLGRQN